MEKVIIRETTGSAKWIEEELNGFLKEGWSVKSVAISASQAGSYSANQTFVFILCKDEGEGNKKSLGFK